MYGYNPMHGYQDPWAMVFASMMAERQEKKANMKKEMKDFLEAIEIYKKAMGGGEKKEEKKDDKWTIGDYFIFYSIIILGGSFISVYFILAELIRFAEIMHK